MSIKSDIVEERVRYRLESVLNEEISNAEYSNQPVSLLKGLRNKIRNSFTESGNIRHFDD